MSDWALICGFAAAGLLGLIIPYFLTKSSRAFKRNSVLVRARVVKLAENRVDAFPDNAPTSFTGFEIISGEHTGKTGSTRMSTKRIPHAVGDEVDAFYAPNSQSIESIGTLDTYSKIAHQSLIVSPLFFIISGYLYYSLILTN